MLSGFQWEQRYSTGKSCAEHGENVEFLSGVMSGAENASRQPGNMKILGKREKKGPIARGGAKVNLLIMEWGSGIYPEQGKI